MSLAAGFNPNPLAPQVLIYDYDGTLQYTYEANAISASPTKDFNLVGLDLHLGTNGDFGSLILLIEDNAGALTDSVIRKTAKIKNQWSVQLYLGKNVAGLSRWFYGKVYDTHISRPGTGTQYLTVTCLGWGVTLKDRVTRMVKNQAKNSDGITVDTSDTTTQIDNLVETLFTDTQQQIEENVTQLANITRNNVCTGCLSGITIPNINEVSNTYSGFISRMASISNTEWYVDWDRDLNLRDPETHDSGILITNDITDAVSVNWDLDKISYIIGNVSWSDSSDDIMYSWIHSQGSFKPAVSSSYTTTPDAADNLDSEWHAIPFTPVTDNIFKIAYRSIKTGTPASGPLEVEIVGDSGGSGPDRTDIRKSLSVPQAELQALGTSTPASWFEIPIRPKIQVVPGEQLYIVIKKYGDASNTVSVNYKSGTGTYWDSTDGSTWTSRTGASNYRVYDARRVLISLEHTNLSNLLSEPREKIFPVRADLEAETVRETLINAASLLGKQKRMFAPLECWVTGDRFPLAAYCRLVDTKSGLDTKAIISTVDISMKVGEDSQLGANTMKLGLQEYLR